MVDEEVFKFEGAKNKVNEERSGDKRVRYKLKIESGIMSKGTETIGSRKSRRSKVRYCTVGPSPARVKISRERQSDSKPARPELLQYSTLCIHSSGLNLNRFELDQA